MWVDVLIMKNSLPTTEYRKSFLLVFKTSSCFGIITVNESNSKLIGKSKCNDFS